MATVKVAGGVPGTFPEVEWIKGKYSKLTGPRFEQTKNIELMEYSITFKKLKMHDAGQYQVRAISKDGQHSAPFELKLKAQMSKGSDKKGPKDEKVTEKEAAADAAFKKRMKRM